MESSKKMLHHLSQSFWAEIPIIFALRDVAPKNILVDLESQKICAMIDLEWAGPDFLGKDIDEMDYPLDDDRKSNESFTDCTSLPYQEQSDFVHAVWAKYGIISPRHKERIKLGRLITDLYDDLTDHEKGESEDGLTIGQVIEEGVFGSDQLLES